MYFVRSKCIPRLYFNSLFIIHCPLHILVEFLEFTNTVQCFMIFELSVNSSCSPINIVGQSDDRRRKSTQNSVNDSYKKKIRGAIGFCFVLQISGLFILLLLCLTLKSVSQPFSRILSTVPCYWPAYSRDYSAPQSGTMNDLTTWCCFDDAGLLSLYKYVLIITTQRKKKKCINDRQARINWAILYLRVSKTFPERVKLKN